MTYNFLSLKSVGIITGTLLVIFHMFALVQSRSLCAWLQKLPRSRVWGGILLFLATLWTFLLVMNVDLGEFSPLRSLILGFVILAAFLSWYFLDEFLAVRSLGVLAMLAAHPVLEACFLEPAPWRLVLVVLAYIWIICGLFWVGMPYVLRDQIAWISSSAVWWNTLCLLGIIIGSVILMYTMALN